MDQLFSFRTSHSLLLSNLFNTILVRTFSFFVLGVLLVFKTEYYKIILFSYIGHRVKFWYLELGKNCTVKKQIRAFE
jgi:hypothetical protein